MSSSIYGHVVSPFSPEEIQQSTGFTCAVKSQQLILQMFDVEVTEQELMDEAFEHGWLSTDGTPMHAVGQLLEMHGVETTTYQHGNVATLMHELAQGHQVIVGVDSGELWDPSSELYEDNAADHAIIVTGIDVTDPNDVRVIVTDPGTGQVCSYKYEQFVDAWTDSRCFMVSTTQAPDIPQLDNLDEGLTETLMDTAFNSLSDTFHNLISGSGLTNLQDLVIAYITDDSQHEDTEQKNSVDEFFEHGALTDYQNNTNNDAVSYNEDTDTVLDTDEGLTDNNSNLDSLYDI